MTNSLLNMNLFEATEGASKERAMERYSDSILGLKQIFTPSYKIAAHSFRSIP